ncbi:ankyrin repeat-containing domain protein [Aspergillus varians]
MTTPRTYLLMSKMAHPILPFELILEIATYLDPAALNALIQTHKRAAVSLTRQLYDIGLSADSLSESQLQLFHSRSAIPNSKPAAVFDSRIWDCIPKWTSELLVDYLLRKLKYDSLCVRLVADPENPNDPDQELRSLHLFLQLAVTAGSLHIVRALIEAGAPVNVTDDDNRTPLHGACRVGQEEIALYLLHAGADPLLRDFIHQVPIGYAVSHMSGAFVARMVQAFRDAGVDPFELTGNRTILLRSAIVHRNEAVVRVLVECGADPVGETWMAGSPPLETSIQYGYESIARFLIQEIINRGGGISYPMSRDRTALHLAVRRGRQELVRYLLESGADVLAIDDRGRTPLHEAVRAEGGHAATIIKLLISYGADPIAKDASDLSILQDVEDQGVPEYAPLILQGMPHSWPADDFRRHLWSAAAEWRKFESGQLKLLVRLLDTRLSAFGELDEDGNTGLHLLCAASVTESNRSLVEMARVLIDVGADLTKRNRKGLTAFHFAVQTPTVSRSTTEMARFLLEYEGIHSLSDGNTIQSVDYTSAVQVLIKAGWCRDALDADAQGHTPIDRGVDKIENKELASRARRLLGSGSEYLYSLRLEGYGKDPQG